MEHESPRILTLPANIVSRVDIGRLLREVEALNGFLEAAAVRQPGSQPRMPKTSRLLDELLQHNKINALIDADRQRLNDFLRAVKNEAPVLHMSFSADAPPLFIQKLTTWLRREIHPLVLLQVGLDPTIGAGAIVRTTNMQFDFSLRQRFIDNRETLIRRLHRAGQTAAETQTAAPAAPQELAQ